MTRNDSLTLRQMLALTFVCLLSPAIRLLPRSAAMAGGSGGWLAPILAAPAAAALAAVLCRLMASRRGSEGLVGVLLRIWGRLPGRAICAALMLWMVFYTGILLRTGAERLLSTVYTGGGPALFMAVTAAGAGIVSLGRLRSLGRLGEVSVPAMCGILALVLLLALPDVEPAELLPEPGREKGVLAASIPVLSVVSKCVFPLLLTSGLERAERPLPRALRWLGLLLLILVGITAATVGAMSASLTARLQHPFFVMIRNISVFGIIERIEAVVIALWVIPDLVFAAALLRAEGVLLSAVTGRTIGRPLHLVFAAGAMICGLAAARDAFSLERLSRELVPAVNLALAFGLMPLSLLVGRLRRVI